LNKWIEEEEVAVGLALALATEACDVQRNEVENMDVDVGEEPRGEVHEEDIVNDAEVRDWEIFVLA